MISKQNLNTIRLTKSLKIRDIKKILKQENKDVQNIYVDQICLN